MNANPSIFISNVDHLQPDDNMQVVSSPGRGMDGYDIDIDHMRDASVEPSQVNNTNEDIVDMDAFDIDNDQAVTTQDLQDDDMVDENDDNVAVDNDEDFNMEAYEEVLEDDEILYDDDEELDTVEEDVALPVVDSTTSDDKTLTNASMAAEAVQGSDRVQPSNDQLTENESELKEEENQQDTVTNQQSTENIEETEHPTTENDQISDPAQHDTVDISEDRADLSQQANTTNYPESEYLQEQHEAVEDTTQAQVTSSKSEPEQLNEEPHLEQHRVAETSQPALQDQESFEHVEHSELQEDASIPAPEPQPSRTIAESNIHPVRIQYLGEDMSLFPPSHDDGLTTFFLADTKLATESLDKMLVSCREVLGDSIGHDDELVLDIPSLGLHICEDSKYAAKLSLTQILDVYLTLLRNDAVGRNEPLHCTLSSRVCTASQYEYLSNSAREGKGFLEISADYVDTPDGGSTHDKPSPEVKEPSHNLEVQAEEPTNEEPVVFHSADEHATVTQDWQEAEPRRLSEESSKEEKFESNITAEAVDTTTLKEPEPVSEHDNSNNDGSDQRELPTNEDEDSTFEAEDVAAETDDFETHSDKAHDPTGSPEDERTPSSHTVEAEDTGVAEGDNYEASEEAIVEQIIHPEEDALGLQYNPEDNVEYSPPNIEGDIQENFDDQNQESADYQEQTDEPDIFAQLDDIDDDLDPFLDDEFSAVDTTGTVQTQTTQDWESPKAEVSTPPATPSQIKSVKRKVVDDEDEFNLLDTDTPEPKRKRSS